MQVGQQNRAGYDDTSIYNLVRGVRDRVDALDRNVIRWNQERRHEIPSGGGNPTYVSGDAFVVSATSTSGASNTFTLAADDYPRQGDYLSIRVRPDSLPIILKGLRFGSPTGPTTMTVAPGTLVNIHAASDSRDDITADYWVVHSTPGSGSPGGTARDPYDVDTAKRKEVVDANVPAYLETNTDYYGKSFVDEVYGPGQPAMYRCMPSAPATSSGVTVWKWFRSDIL